jgi:folate-dependent phosphoribosylglycinamide formyltransferase PurN
MRTLLICHADAPLDREGLARWLKSFSTLTGVVVVAETAGRLRTRIAREVRRVGWMRFVDVVAFRAYYAVTKATRDREWERAALDRIRARYPQNPNTSELITGSPNSSEAKAFIRASQPDMVIARCKTLLAERIFSIPPLGTFVMHPGICPEYRNAHGCFWARASGDDDNIGMTLLRIDNGVDTGPVIGYFRIRPEAHESHVVTQHRVVLEHLDGIRDSLVDVAAGRARPIDTTGRRSATWGQPWLSAYIAMRRRTRHRERTAEGLALQQKP